MSREAFIDKKFTDISMDKIKLVNAILDEYSAQRFDLSLRQLYYQMVARGYIENSQRSYKNLGGLVTDARLAGRVDWRMIVDRSRATLAPSHWKSPAEIVESAARSFAIDKWEDQPNHVEVMVEKDALSGVLGPVCRDFDINFTANKGYPSSSLLYRMSKRLLQNFGEGKKLYILHLGDHDPSGIDMTRDLVDRFDLFTGIEFQVLRLALNIDQVRELNPPENPAKVSDSRYGAYVIELGQASWELDAIEPGQLADIVGSQLRELRDESLWDEAFEREQSMRTELKEFAKTYENKN